MPPVTTIPANPSDYQILLSGLQPGERLLLAAGTYPSGLSIDGLNGTLNNCIVIEGPEIGPPAVFIGRDCCNTVSIRNSSYVAIRNLEIDGQGRLGDGVKAEFLAVSHHITLENLYLHGQNADQQIVGINTKGPTWNWVIRRNVIEGAGTGLYLGNSDGNQEFVNGLIEHNLVRDTIGYNMQIKHQNGRNPGQPTSGTTIVRHNVFSKAQGASTGVDARPNLLVGHWPLSGPGANDTYQIYGNFFYQNPVEALFQGEGNVALYDNLFVNDFAPGFPTVSIQPHNDVPKAIEVFHNTVVAAGAGISVTGGGVGFDQRVRGNAVFAATPISASDAFDNSTDAYGAAGSYLVNPTAPLGSGLDLYPLIGMLAGNLVDMSGLTGFPDYDRDFNGFPRGFTFRGAYSGEGTNPGWAIDLDRKPEPAPPLVDISIDDVTLPEGNTGTASAVFTVSLSSAATQTVSVEYATSDGTASAGTDYEAVSGSISFPAGATSKTVVVSITGDWVFESDETFFVNLSNPVGGALVDDRGDGIISNDDAPGLTIADVIIAEPGSGTSTAVFTVTLSPTSGSTVTVNYATADDSAMSPDDFQSTSESLSFPPGTSTRALSVQVNFDAVDEGNEQFFVDLSGSSGAAIARPRATGLIFDPGAFFTLGPCRALDTREPGGPTSGAPLTCGFDQDFTMIGGACGVPASAKAVSLNVTVTQPTAQGNLRLFASGTPTPLVSSLNYVSGLTRANNAVAPLSASGQIAVRCAPSGTTHVILDINGYFQ